jgi:exopolysaccharide biosynthesis protein
LRFALSEPGGSREVRRETTLDFLKRSHAQLAINAHFFLPFPSTDTEAWVIGLAASDGRVFSACEAPEQNYALVADAPALNIDSHNHASIVHCDPAAADGLHVKEPVDLWTTLAGAAQIVTDGRATIPVYRDADRPDGALTPGGPRNYSNANSWYDVVTARSAIGLSRDGRTLTLFTVDARGGSAGMKVGEVAALLIADCGVWNALNLDGGGSTSLAMEDPTSGVASLLNTSSDSPAGRAVGTSLAVFARPPR